jgi:hypothetical protein
MRTCSNYLLKVKRKTNIFYINKHLISITFQMLNTVKQTLTKIYYKMIGYLV